MVFKNPGTIVRLILQGVHSVLVRFAVILTILLVSPGGPSSILALQTGDLRVDTDIAQFRYNEQENYVEIYYAFDVSQLTYTPEDDLLQGGLLLHGALASPEDQSVILDRVWSVPHQVADSASLKPGNTVVGVIGLAIPQGAYTLTLESFDLNDTSLKHVDYHHLPLRSFMGEEISISDVELCSFIGKATDATPSTFYKNTLEVVPNPGRVYTERLSSLDYYVEAYNFPVSEEVPEFTTSAKVYDSRGNEVVSRNRARPRVHESSVEVGSIDVSSLPPGSYVLEFAVVDSATDSRVSSSKEFYIYGPQGLDRGTGVWVSVYEGMNEEDLDREFAMARYVALDTEIALYETLTSLQAKGRFLFEFWRRRDSLPETVENEYKQEFMQRVEVANTRFRSANKEGWETDRGRVFIVYGPPDEYERHDSGPMTKPYEVCTIMNSRAAYTSCLPTFSGFRTTSSSIPPTATNCGMTPGSSRSGKTESTSQSVRADLLLILFLAVPLSVTSAQGKLTADSLLADLGCSGCHPGVEVASNVEAKAPDLSHAGLRYQEGYLFDYLQHPVPVRRHIGLSRMPGFDLSPKEALALVLFLTNQSTVPSPEGRLPSLVRDSSRPALSPGEMAAEGKEIIKPWNAPPVIRCMVKEGPKQWIWAPRGTA